LIKALIKARLKPHKITQQKGQVMITCPISF
jgi:hypothetical protein